MKDAVVLLLIALVVPVVTFPENDWSFSAGIDPPLFWVFNLLFENGLKAGQHMIFPHGPLAFFMYPLSENILLVSLVTTLLKFLLVVNTYLLLDGFKKQLRLPLVLAFSYLLSVVSGFNQLLLTNILLLYCNYYVNRSVAIKLTAFVLTAFALYVKAYVAILSGTLYVSFLTWQAFTNRKLKNTVFNLGVMPVLMLLFWLVMYGSFSGFLHYVSGMLHLAQDNSAAAALYPHNNWWLILFSMAGVLALPIINRSSKSIFFFLLFLLSLFAAWKHGMAREDVFHVKGLLTYLAIGLSVYILFLKKNWTINLAISLAVLTLFSLNLKNSINYQPLKYDFWGGTHFVEFITRFHDLKDEAHRKTAANLASQRMSERMLATIGNASVDIYPWDYSIAAINNLNWKPRVVIQSYAAYTSWLDRQNADYFNSEEAPEFIVWEKQKGTADLNGSEFNSLDYRYLLNDEPQTLLQLFSNYEPVDADEKFLLLKKRDASLALQTEAAGTSSAKWDEWMDVPYAENSLLRVKPDFPTSLKQRMKSFFYKDEQYWIYLKTENGSILKYRIVPKNAADGIWINPFLFDSEHAYQISQILFKTSDTYLSGPLNLKWEKIRSKDLPGLPYNFFRISPVPDTVLLQSRNSFEQDAAENWSPISADQKSENAYSGTHAQGLRDIPYSSTFSSAFDSLIEGRIRIEADAWVFSPSYHRSHSVSLVISMEDAKGQYFYKSENIDEQVIGEQGWNHVFSFAGLNEIRPGSRLKVYFWNRGDKDLQIDDFSVKILKQDHQ